MVLCTQFTEVIGYDQTIKLIGYSRTLACTQEDGKCQLVATWQCPCISGMYNLQYFQFRLLNLFLKVFFLDTDSQFQYQTSYQKFTYRCKGISFGSELLNSNDSYVARQKAMHFKFPWVLGDIG